MANQQKDVNIWQGTQSGETAGGFAEKTPQADTDGAPVASRAASGEPEMRSLAECQQPASGGLKGQSPLPSCRGGLRKGGCNPPLQSGSEHRTKQILCLGDSLLARLQQATDELGQTITTHKRKSKSVEYAQGDAKGKPAQEVIIEEEILEVVPSPIDRMGLRQLTSALKELQTIVKTAQEPEAAQKLQVEFSAEVRKAAE